MKLAKVLISIPWLEMKSSFTKLLGWILQNKSIDISVSSGGQNVFNKLKSFVEPKNKKLEDVINQSSFKFGLNKSGDFLSQNLNLIAPAHPRIMVNDQEIQTDFK